MPVALLITSARVLSEKHECSSSCSLVSRATAMRSPASSPADRAPMPRRMVDTAWFGSFRNSVRYAPPSGFHWSATPVRSSTRRSVTSVRYWPRRSAVGEVV